MLKTVLFEMEMFAPGEDEERARKDLVWLLEALSQRNQSYLRAHPDTPKIYEAGLKYAVPSQMDPESVPEVTVVRNALGSKLKDPDVAAAFDRIEEVFCGERFRDIPAILKKGTVDCDNLACYRVAELREAGIPAFPYVTARTRPDGGTTMHAIVGWPPIGPSDPPESSEDPSRILGMGDNSEEAVAARSEEHRKNAERREVLANKIRAAVEAGKMTKVAGADAVKTLVGLLPPATRSRI